MKVLKLKSATLQTKYKSINSKPQEKKEIEDLLKQGNMKIDNKDKTKEYSYEKCEKYAISHDKERFGYYLVAGEKYERITNFIIVLSKRTVTIDQAGKRSSSFDGYIKFSDDNKIPFSNSRTSIFGTLSKIISFVDNLSGTQTRIYNHKKELVNAIKVFNPNVVTISSKELGYNKELTEFYTPTLTIKKDEIIQTENPIRFSEYWQGKKVDFVVNQGGDYDDEYLDELKKFIYDKFFQWENRDISISAFSFAMLPVIYPFLNNITGVKPYYLLIGHSGSGKTSFLRYIQKLYGDNGSLYNWTSTVASITEIGHSLKDSLFILDDMKKKNFINKSKIDEATTLMQNYADQSSKSRAVSTSALADRRFIRGMLMMTGEHIVFDEESTIARGIIVNHRKYNAPESKKVMDEGTEQLKYFMPYFIQHILTKYSKEKIQNLYYSNQDYIMNEAISLGLKGDNLHRVVNNIALLNISWIILRDYLFAKNECLKGRLDYEFNKDLINILKENFGRIQNFNPETLFENRFWQLIEDEELIIESVANGGDITNKTKGVGLYKKDRDDQIIIGIKYSKIFNRIDSLLKSQGGLSLKKKELKQRLIESNKIKANNSGTVSIGNGFRGVYWIGEIPNHIKDEFFN